MIIYRFKDCINDILVKDSNGHWGASSNSSDIRRIIKGEKWKYWAFPSLNGFPLKMHWFSNSQVIKITSNHSLIEISL